jgi:hypothetical protein
VPNIHSSLVDGIHFCVNNGIPWNTVQWNTVPFSADLLNIKYDHSFDRIEHIQIFSMKPLQNGHTATKAQWTLVGQRRPQLGSSRRRSPQRPSNRRPSYAHCALPSAPTRATFPPNRWHFSQPPAAPTPGHQPQTATVALAADFSALR